MYGYINIGNVITLPPPIRNVEKYSLPDIKVLTAIDSPIAGHNIGIKTCLITCQEFPPKVLAISSISTGIPFK